MLNVKVKITVSLGMMQYYLVEGYQPFGGTYCFKVQGSLKTVVLK
jgi:hypothetical protein